MNRAMEGQMDRGYIIRIDNEKLELAFKMLAEAVERGNYTSYKDISFDCSERVVVITDLDSDSIRISLEHVPLLALDLLKTYFGVRNAYRELVRKFESGVWD
jgi:hypothetical protein